MLIPIFIALIMLMVLLMPFFFKGDPWLSGYRSFDSIDQLKSLQNQILERYLSDEKAFTDKIISQNSWNKRQSFLVMRYVDVTKRLDFLQMLMPETKEQ